VGPAMTLRRIGAFVFFVALAFVVRHYLGAVL
jgi:hypothetical protein